MRQKLVRVTLKNGESIEVLPCEVEVLRRAGKLMDTSAMHSEHLQPEKKPAYRLPVLTSGQRKARIKEAKKLKRQGYSIREIGRRLGVSHVAVIKWFR